MKSVKEQMRIIKKGAFQIINEEELALKLVEFYETAFSKGAIPKDIPTLVIDWEFDTMKDILPLLVEQKFAASTSELRRILIQGGIQLNQEKLEDLSQVLINGDILKIGKKKFVKIIK